MKILLVFFIYTIAVLAKPHAKIDDSENDLTSEEASIIVSEVKRCLDFYNINNRYFGTLFLPNYERKHLFDKLSGYQRGCLRACLSLSATWRNADGTINVEDLLKDEKLPDVREKHAKFVTSFAECKIQANNDECEFYHCLEKKLKL